MTHAGHCFVCRRVALKRVSLILFSCLFVAACSQKTLELPEPVVPVFAVADLQTRLNNFDSWNLQTRIAVRHQDWGWRGMLHWVQRGNTFKMVFTSLMGNRVMLIEGLGDGRIVATDAKRRQRQSNNIDAVVEDLLGIAVNQNDLHFWLRGAPAPDKDYQDIELSQSGRISSFRQNGWLVQYDAYHNESCRSWLPQQIILSQPTTQLWLNIRSHSLPDGTKLLC